MSDIISSITEHENFKFKDGQSDDLYYALMAFLTDHVKKSNVSPTEIVGVLEWAKSSIIIMNTNFTEE